MPGYLKDRPSSRTSRAAALALADAFDTVAQRIASASRSVERELTRWVQEGLETAAKCGYPVERPLTSHPSAAHTGAGHRHDLLCEAPTIACDDIQRISTLLRQEDLPASLPRVYVHAKDARSGERMDVERSLEWLAQWAYDHELCDQGTPVQGFARPCLPGARQREQRRADAVRRVTYELDANGRDSDLTRAIRGLAQATFNGAGAIDAVVGRMATENVDVLGESLDDDLVLWRPRFISPSLMATNAALLMNKSQGVSRFLQRLDLTIRMRCLFAPYDHAPRGKRPEQTLYLAQIKDLDESGFTEMEIAQLIDDGELGDLKARARRVRSNLERDLLRDRRTKHIEGRRVA